MRYDDDAADAAGEHAQDVADAGIYADGLTATERRRAAAHSPECPCGCRSLASLLDARECERYEGNGWL